MSSVKFVPLEGLCYLCFHVPFLLYAFLDPTLRAMVLPLRYARAMTQQGRGELKAGRGKSSRGAMLEGSPLSIQADHGVRDRKDSRGAKSVCETELLKHTEG